MAHLGVSKCCDSLPLYRMDQQFARLDIPMSRSTMTDLVHRTGELLAPLAARIVELIAQSEIVLAAAAEAQDAASPSVALSGSHAMRAPQRAVSGVRMPGAC